ncbi:MAG: hypothetical protein M3032_10215, partial [Verrucomicrobiota bacterium]|nr:hypothetical protein [Verrucomicrobiota bacterium]
MTRQRNGCGGNTANLLLARQAAGGRSNISRNKPAIPARYDRDLRKSFFPSCEWRIGRCAEVE